MKKLLPFILLGIGIFVFIGIFISVKNRNATPVEEIEEEEVVAELPADQRPFTSLIPSKDGHEVTLKIEDINIPDVDTLDYELLYKVKDGRTQGIPGTVSVKGKDMIEREGLLFGSESSGRKRYDEGVEFGTLTLRFRNSKGKLIGKLTTDFHLQTGTVTLTSKDESFTYKLPKVTKGVWYITMMPFGKSASADNLVVQEGDYAVFSSQ